jgi:hypothetical protein
LDVLGTANAPGIGGVTRDAKRCQVRRGGQVMIQQFPPQALEPVDVGDRQVGNDIAHGGEPSPRAGQGRVGRGDRDLQVGQPGQLAGRGARHRGGR